MPIRFIIGRAGSGKTHHCLEAIRARLRQDPIDGPRLILLVPEQASLQMERAIIEPKDIGGSHRAEVLSFRRLAYRVLEAVGWAGQRAISEPARAMILRHIIAGNAAKMQYYRRPERLGGFVDQLSVTVTELIHGAIAPTDLATILDQGDPEDALQRAKLHDVHLIFAEYLSYLGTERLDPSQYLQVARECLSRVRWLSGAEVWVDGFASLTRQEVLTLTELARFAASMEITLLCDPDLCAARPATVPGPLQQLFAKTLRSYLDLHDMFTTAGVAIEDPIFLAKGKTPRFKENESLARLERTLFASPEATPSQTDVASPGVELIELPSHRVEVDYAVSRICRWVQDRERPLRYRDIAVVVRDLEPYHDLLTNALHARGIPFFIDRRHPTAHHPLVELLRTAVAAAATDLSMDAARGLLKTGLTPLSSEAADELENYILAQGIAGFETWSREDWSFMPRSAFAEDEEHREPGPYEKDEQHRVNAARKVLWDALSEWLSAAKAPDGHSGRQWADLIVALLNRLEVARRLAVRSAAAEQDGDIDQAEEHGQVWRDTLGFLDDLAFAFSDTTLTVSDLASVLESGLSQFTLGLAPPMLDQVLVGAIERSRHPELKAVIILGFNEGLFPRIAAEDSIFNDDDRTLLLDAGLSMSPPARQRTLEEALLFYVAATRASRNLVVTYATADNDGRALRPSPYLAALKAAALGLEVKPIGDPTRTRETWDVLTPRDLQRRLVAEFSDRSRLQSEDRPELRAKWNELYESTRRDNADDEIARRTFSSLKTPPQARLSADLVEKLIGGTFRTSVSELETHAACPFQHFAKYVLRLRERTVAELQPVDVGKVHHAILEDFVNTLWERRLSFSQLSEAEVNSRLSESCGRIAARLPEEGELSYARDAYILRRSASQLSRVLRAQRLVGAAGRARPRAGEVPYGFKGTGSLPALELDTPGGRRILLRGYIDRVDLAELADEMLGIVIDYKRTRNKRLDLSSVYHGLSLQLVAYLLVLSEHGESLAGRPIHPIGAFYVSLLPQYEAVDHPSAAEIEEETLPGAYRPRGLLNAQGLDVLDGQLGESGRSQYFSVFRKKDGKIGYIDSSDGAEPGDFQAILRHAAHKLATLADGILDGDVSVNPYRLRDFSPCSWCPMSSVCRFEMGLSDVRFLESLKRSEVFARVRQRPSA